MQKSNVVSSWHLPQLFQLFSNAVNDTLDGLCQRALGHLPCPVEAWGGVQWLIFISVVPVIAVAAREDLLLEHKASLPVSERKSSSFSPPRKATGSDVTTI